MSKLKPLSILDRVDRIRIAAEATCDERSVVAVYSGRAVRSTTKSRVLTAAKKLKLPLPPGAR